MSIPSWKAEEYIGTCSKGYKYYKVGNYIHVKYPDKILFVNGGLVSNKWVGVLCHISCWPVFDKSISWEEHK